MRYAVANAPYLPMQLPEIPLDILTPGLKMKLTYEGPVQKPTAASISFTYTIGAGSSKKKPAMTETEKLRAENARMAAEQAKFREGLKTPEQPAKESAQFWDAFWRMKSMEPGNLLGIPGLKPKKPEDESLQRQAIGSAQSVDSVPPSVDETLAQSGQPLDDHTQTFMESRFGHDFSQVRVHNNAKAAESAKGIKAKAYTVGQNIVFGAGEYAPRTTTGQKLLAHELTHTLQQGKH